MDAPAPLDPAQPSDVARMRQHLAAGGLALLPTDTVPGLAVDVRIHGAAQRLAEYKESPAGRPFSLHLRDVEELRALLPAPPPGLAAWLHKLLPGPWTVLLPRTWVALPSEWEWPWDLVGLRLPGGADWAAWGQQLEAPVLMSSVNQAGQPPRQGVQLASWCADRPELLLGLSPAQVSVGQASTVLAFDPLPRVVRDAVSLSSALPLPGLRVLCVCTGNTCRSPIAEELLKQELASAWGVRLDQLPKLGWQIASAGTMGFGGSPASEGSRQVAAEAGIDLSEHQSAALEERLEQGVDLVLGMTESHLAVLPAGLRAELFDPMGRSIPDPYGAPVEIYRRTLAALQEAAAARVQAFSAWPECGQSSVTGSV
jgi:protein-tyrosine-phosphatase/tRNA A37 threonylcarbamoyladenosine synthetase subunit TsaC/SUA5/YrdC